MMKYLYILLIPFLLIINVCGQETTTPIEEMSREEIMNLTLDQLLEMDMDDLVYIAQKLGISIDDLLKMKTTVASKTESTPRETPGIISVITEDDIIKSGSQDIMDVLYLVPGINFTYDADGVVGIQMRGNWAFEGKVSILIDGQEINDLKYLIVPFGHHFSVDQIQRIEIIRGPGSSIYGGTAELGVINIITKSGADINGAEATVSYGYIPNTNGNIRATANLGEKRGDFTYSLTGSYIDGDRSDKIFHADSGVYFDLKDQGSALTSKNVNLGFAYKDLSVRAIYDNYFTEYQWEGELFPNEFKTWLGEIKYDWKINDKLSFTPKYNFRRSIPYFEEGYSGNNDIRRNELGITSIYSTKSGSNISAGLSYYNDAALSMYKTADSYIYFKDDSTYKLTFSNITGFAQAFIKMGQINIIAGGRIDIHSEYGAAFAPRLGLTCVGEKLHFKLLLNRAFRSPSFGNIIFEPDIRPEFTWVGEVESGYKINENMFINCNLFYTQISNSIVWYDSTEYYEEAYGYTNAGKTGTYGLEIEYRALYQKGSARLNYSYYSCKGINEIEMYRNPDNESMLMGSPNHKITASGNYNIYKGFWVLPSLIFWSGANSYGGFNSLEEDLGNIWFEPVTIVNLFALYKHKSIELSLGVKDIFNSHKYYIQGYVGFAPPLPAPSRQGIIKLSYRFNTSKL